jgi:hypothetical protein
VRHNRWLAWKLKHGLASRGRVGGALHPKGLLAGLLYKYHFKKYDRASKEPRVFQQSVGGTLGPSGDMK